MGHLSTHIFIKLSFLETKRAGTAHGLRLSLTRPLAINSSTYLWTFMVFMGFIL